MSRFLNFLLSFVTTIFCGHIGNAELAGYALASAVKPIVHSNAEIDKMMGKMVNGSRAVSSDYFFKSAKIHRRLRKLKHRQLDLFECSLTCFIITHLNNLFRSEQHYHLTCRETELSKLPSLKQYS